MGRRARLPGAPETERIVCHVDMDCFYAACERLREPALRGEPLVVGMGYEPGTTNGAVATASYEAREYGVESAQAISEALDHLPRKIEAARDDELSVDEAGFYRPVDMEYYESVAADIKEILHDHGDTVREVSIDEAYLDLTPVTDWASAAEFGRGLKERIADRVGVTASIGVAPTMSAAKVASDHDKPDGLVVVEPGELEAFLAPLDVADVHGVGPVTASRMREMGIETAGDLAEADPAELESVFGERGRRVHRFARGEDDRPVEPKGKPKSFSRESAFGQATTDATEQRQRLLTLAEAVADRANRRGVLYQTIGIKVVEPPFEVNTRARSLPGPVDDDALVPEVATDLFTEFAGERIRKLGVRVSNLSFSDETQQQLSDVTGSADAADGSSGGNPAVDEESDETSGQRTLGEFDRELCE